ncbi:hypothetical protein [Sphingomonas phyllosphaerae]|uniref:hypothetical protein n=1 Tax=Sphingomonas phyllosphaerae TaxID=257003 RepID=UPI0024137223|nr:hypothetical protein [Sphingomonas phyllosphaerae]
MTDLTTLRLIQIALRWAWDPIGVRRIEEAADEYDGYAPCLLEMLRADAPAAQIAEYLSTVVRDRMELPAEPDRDMDLASMLQQMFVVTR